MKNFILILTFFMACHSFAQMTKADYETAINAIPGDAIEEININNQRTFYTDGSSKITSGRYDYEKTTITASETSLSLYYYKDASKTELKSVSVFPYAAIENFSVATTFINIKLNGR